MWLNIAQIVKWVAFQFWNVHIIFKSSKHSIVYKTKNLPEK